MKTFCFAHNSTPLGFAHNLQDYVCPSASYNDVIHILNNCPSHDEGLFFAFLADIKPDPYYGFKVMFEGKEANQPKYVATLIGSPNKSQAVAAGTGWKVTTSGITDIATCDNTENAICFTVLRMTL